MGKYLLRRILQMIPVVLGTTLLIYALVFALPGDPVKAMFGDKPVNEAVAAQIRAEYNLDKPFVVQYLLFLKNALTLDFGKTFAGQEVIDVIGRAFPVTIKLAIMAFCFEAIFGVVFGIISGLKKGKWYDSVILVVSLLLISVPTFVTGFVMQYFLGVEWRILPVTAGANNILKLPEFRDADKAHELMSFMVDNPESLPVPANGASMQILIGPENVNEALKDTSVVVASYDIGDNMRGLIGVVGPTRMDYATVAARLSYFAEGLTKMFGKQESFLPKPKEDSKE